MKKSTIGVLAGATLLGTMFVGVGTASATVTPACVVKEVTPATTKVVNVTEYKWVPKVKTSDGQTQWTIDPAADKNEMKEWTVKGQTVTYVPEFDSKGKHKSRVTETTVTTEAETAEFCDTPVSVENSWVYDPATGNVSGQVVNPDLSSTATPVFTAEYTFETDKSWDATRTGGARKHQYTRSIDLKEVTATPIIGDQTGTVYGWNVVMGDTTSTPEPIHITSDSDTGPATYNVAQHHRVTVDLRQDGVEVARTGIVGGSPTDTPTAGSKFLTPLA